MAHRPGKPWHRSRTLWVNACGASLVAVTAAAGDNIAALQAVLPPHFYAWLAFGLAVVNSWLRVMTDTPLRRRCDDDPRIPE